MKKKIKIIFVILLLAGIGAGTFINNAYVPPVIMYHSICNDSKDTKLSVSPASFERQMKFLKDNHYNIVTLEEMGRYIKDGMRPPYNTIAITFDDGIYDSYQNAYPVLKKYRIPATMFIITGKIGQFGYLGWKDVREMSDSGLITIGSHTVTHEWLPTVSADKLRTELTESKAILEKNTAKQVNTFCYPYGAYGEREKEAVKNEGYIYAATTGPRNGDAYGDSLSIRRIKISRTSDNLFVFWFETSGYYTWFKRHKK
jgi:peptidoglycan/xylan/chitin deacetylase (PgdA/CDA1 family)